MIDAKITDAGDIAVANGDIALTGRSTTDKDIATCLSQMARMALSTERGDLLLHTALGNELAKLIGMPNKTSTAALGVSLIKAALVSWGITNKVTVVPWPPDHNTLAFEVRISLGQSGKELTFVLKQALNTAP